MWDRGSSSISLCHSTGSLSRASVRVYGSSRALARLAMHCETLGGGQAKMLCEWRGIWLATCAASHRPAETPPPEDNDACSLVSSSSGKPSESIKTSYAAVGRPPDVSSISLAASGAGFVLAGGVSTVSSSVLPPNRASLKQTETPFTTLCRRTSPSRHRFVVL